MDQNQSGMNQNPAGAPPPNQTPPTQPSMPPKDHMGSAGPIIGSLIIIVVLVLGGIYFLGSKMETVTPNGEEQAAAEQAALDEDTSNIEADLDAMGTADLDNESTAIEAALQ